MPLLVNLNKTCDQLNRSTEKVPPLQVRGMFQLPWLIHRHPTERKATVLVRGVNSECPKGQNKQETRELLQGS